jgi:hypothetical protein
MMDTVPSLVAHPDNLAFTEVGPVPPPDSVSGGENLILASTEQVTDPGAAPENFACLVLAATGYTTRSEDNRATRPTVTAKCLDLNIQDRSEWLAVECGGDRLRSPTLSLSTFMRRLL